MTDPAERAAIIDELRTAIAERRVVAVVGPDVAFYTSGGEAVATPRGFLESGVRRCENLQAKLGPRSGRGEAGFISGIKEWADTTRKRIAGGGTDELRRVAEEIDQRLVTLSGPGEVGSWVRETIGALKPVRPDVIRSLADLGIPLATTNRDDLIEQVTGSRVLHVGPWCEPTSLSLPASAIVSHGLSVALAETRRAGSLMVGFDDSLRDELPRVVGEDAFAGRRHYFLTTERGLADRTLPGAERLAVLSYAGEEELTRLLRDLRPDPKLVEAEKRLQKAEMARLKRAEAEIATLVRSIESDPGNSFSAFLELRRLCQEHGKWRELVGAAEKIADASEGARAASFYLSAADVLERELKRPDEARGAARAALEAKPNDVKILVEIQGFFERAALWEDAIAAIEQQVPLVSAPKEKADLLRRAGALYEVVKEPVAARRAYERARELVPDDVATLERIRAVAEMEGETELVTTVDAEIAARADLLPDAALAAACWMAVKPEVAPPAIEIQYKTVAFDLKQITTTIEAPPGFSELVRIARDALIQKVLSGPKGEGLKAEGVSFVVSQLMFSFKGRLVNLADGSFYAALTSKRGAQEQYIDAHEWAPADLTPELRQALEPVNRAVRDAMRRHYASSSNATATPPSPPSPPPPPSEPLVSEPDRVELAPIGASRVRVVLSPYPWAHEAQAFVLPTSPTHELIFHQWARILQEEEPLVWAQLEPTVLEARKTLAPGSPVLVPLPKVEFFRGASHAILATTRDTPDPGVTTTAIVRVAVKHKLRRIAVPMLPVGTTRARAPHFRSMLRALLDELPSEGPDALEVILTTKRRSVLDQARKDSLGKVGIGQSDFGRASEWVVRIRREAHLFDRDPARGNDATELFISLVLSLDQLVGVTGRWVADHVRVKDVTVRAGAHAKGAKGARLSPSGACVLAKAREYALATALPDAKETDARETDGRHLLAALLWFEREYPSSRTRQCFDVDTDRAAISALLDLIKRTHSKDDDPAAWERILVPRDAGTDEDENASRPTRTRPEKRTGMARARTKSGGSAKKPPRPEPAPAPPAIDSFALSISLDVEGRIRVRRDGSDWVATETKLDDLERDHRELLRKIRLPSSAQANADRRAPWSEYRTLGTKLFGASLGRFADAFRGAMGEARRNRRSFAIVLELCPDASAHGAEAPQIRTASLPWEVLYDSEHQTHLGLMGGVAIVRRLGLDATAPIDAPEPRALECAVGLACPTKHPADLGGKRIEPLHSERELRPFRSLREAHRDVFDFEEVSPLSRNSLVSALKAEPAVFHFFGHGHAGRLYLEKPHPDTEADPVGIDVLRAAFQGLRTPSLAVLNCCSSASEVGSDPVSGVAQTLLVAGVPVVVAMQGPLFDEAGALFAETFYLELAMGKDPALAAQEGRQRLFITRRQEDVLGPDWCLPVVYSRAKAPFAIADRGRASGALRKRVVEIEREIETGRARIAAFERVTDDDVRAVLRQGAAEAATIDALAAVVSDSPGPSVAEKARAVLEDPTRRKEARDRLAALPRSAPLSARVPRTELEPDHGGRLEIGPDVLRGEALAEIRKRYSFPSDLLPRIVAELASGRHVLLIGPAGTGKTSIAKEIVRALGYEAHVATASADWTTFEVVGGFWPQPIEENGSTRVEHVFRPGAFAEAVLKNWEEGGPPFRRRHADGIRGWWLVLDELNRADMDRAFGGVFTALEDLELRVPDVAFEKGRSPTTVLPIPEDFRVIATLNGVDRHYLFRLSDALKRRFAFVEVPVTDAIDDEWEKICATLRINWGEIEKDGRGRAMALVRNFVYLARAFYPVGSAQLIAATRLIQSMASMGESDVGLMASQAITGSVLPGLEEVGIDVLRVLRAWAKTGLEDALAKAIKNGAPPAYERMRVGLGLDANVAAFATRLARPAGSEVPSLATRLEDMVHDAELG